MHKILFRFITLMLLTVHSVAYSFSISRSLHCKSIWEKDDSKTSTKNKQRFSKDVWSVIEVDQKVNEVLFSPFNGDSYLSEITFDPMELDV